MGMPLAIDFARVKASGAASGHICHANQLPVRPMPHWTSSHSMSRPFSSQSFRTPRMNSGVAGITPPSPCTTSNITATVCLLMAASTDARSLKSA